ncbi:Asparagine--tRNA ligase, cytoplasmic [Paramicrosporidium saccamoebae]|uniref:asparagine--tRNA ligase n=1 Tax=Paramicrosporidium saccamoebae TaxID=1246581 RepID=A0A2H9TNI1_9FUNG|nr:Asparagine--tRNA ligase, cytoplasmic [Paramicrosporidium saccamoebae]
MFTIEKPTRVVHVCTLSGSDESGDGSRTRPYGSLAHALSRTIDGGEISIPKDSKFLIWCSEDGEFREASKSAMKKAIGQLELMTRKALKQTPLAMTDDTPSQLEYKTLVEDPTLPAAQKIKIRAAEKARIDGKRVVIFGWAHRVRMQGKSMMFVTLRDGSGYLQCLLGKEMCKSSDTPRLTVESTVALYGTLVTVPEGKSAPGGHELIVDYWKIIHAAPSGLDAFETKLNKEAGPEVMYDQRHLVLRGETASSLMKLRSVFLQAFRQHYDEQHYVELTTPCLTQTECEGGSTLFKLDYYGEPAYLTQSSQLYLETAIPSMGDVFSVQMSFRAEASRTRRHLSEFTHIEAEMPFITYDELLERLEFLVCDVIEKALSSPARGMILELNPDLKVPQRPFRRMQYKDAIEWLRQADFRKDDGTLYEFGEDIPEKPERFMVDTLGEPIFLCRFPAAMKAFYMFRDEEDPTLTHSTDLLMPGVGEIIGGSMRIWDYDEIMAGYAREGIDPKFYYWYTDQRKYGSCPHGGYGLGFERFLAWALKRDHVREQQCGCWRSSGRESVQSMVSGPPSSPSLVVISDGLTVSAGDPAIFLPAGLRPAVYLVADKLVARSATCAH